MKMKIDQLLLKFMMSTAA